jgi:hypothetical protein
MGWAYLTQEEAQRTIEPNTLTSLRSHNSTTADVETEPKLIKYRGGKTFREDVGELRCHRDMKDVDLTDDNLLSDEMKINRHMLRALMLNGVGGEVHNTDVIAVNESAARWWSLELMQEMAQPGGLSHTIGDGTVLGFGARAGDDNLPLGRPGDQVVPEEHDIARCGVTSVRAGSPVGVGVDDKVGAGRAAQQQAEVRRPTKIAQDAFHGRQVRLPRVVHVQADLLHGISDVGLCERQVLEGSGNASELRGVRNRRPRVVSQLHLEVDWSRTRLAVRHDYPLEDVKCVGALVEEQPIWMTLDSDVEEVVKRPEVLHGEFPLKSGNSATQKLHVGRSQDDIINT